MSRWSRRDALSPMTCLYAAMLLVSSTFMREVARWILRTGGTGLVSAVVWMALSAMLAAIVLFARRTRVVPWAQLSIAIGIGLVLMAVLEIPEERIHIPKYGALGVLAA